ncbi:TIGR03619 family F420-dependent LLM class oxidoreductase [Catenulispora pinisilvae]|uniref:TIGR03619 family F420-dependent LLM class oxidoreductase n=1 Tax=Catenulispora pinisilvae TaxID=2705253 RepID=UPI001890E883|nr:TIGR03619 family F420-dependent LLM class oxidoreductase [Catenulispora pinisilvae]
MRIGFAPHRLWPTDPTDLTGVLDTARRVERLGFDHVIVGDHLLAGDLGLSPDPLVLLSAIAGATSRIRLATSILIAPLYQPIVVAHQAATLDALSGGRFVLGVGTGWDQAEFDAVGVPFNERGKRTDAGLATLRALWRGESDVLLGMPPRTPDGPPIWVGGGSDAALRRALRFGAAWHGSGDPEAVTATRARLARLAEGTDRDPDTLDVTIVSMLLPPGFELSGKSPGPLLGGDRPSKESIADELGRLAQAGVSACSMWAPVDAAALPDVLEWAAAELM